MSSRRSPVRRRHDEGKGRQVDCIRQQKAYEIKLRVTIAASGQGRWQEELDFPEDCRASGFTPVLVVLDPTPNPKLTELRQAFLAQRGEVYIGTAAWAHLESAAGPIMAKFLEKYVREPIQALMAEVPSDLPEMTLNLDGRSFQVLILGERLSIPRNPQPNEETDVDEMPEDVSDEAPGP